MAKPPFNRRRMTPEQRAHLADIARRAQAERQNGGRERVWTEERIALIRAAFAEGGRSAALAALPEMSKSKVCAALRRYCLGPQSAPTGIRAALAASHVSSSCWDDPTFNRRLLEALSGMTQFEHAR